MSPDLIDAALRSLDPADREVAIPPPVAHHGPNLRRQPRRRLALAAAAVATVVAGAVAVPSLTGGSGAAFASWRPDAIALGTNAAAVAGGQCVDRLRHAQSPDAGHLSDTNPVVAETRGEWQLVVLADRAGYSAVCIGDTNFKEWFGSDNRPSDIASPDQRQLVPVDLGTGNLAHGDISVAIGRAGSDVTGVRYDSASHGSVEATVGGGWFALWVPGDDMENQAPDGVPVTVTYNDGTSQATTLGFAAPETP